MQYKLIIDDAERDYLRAIVQSTLMRDAQRLADSDPRRDADRYAKAQSALQIGAQLLAALAPSRIEVATGADPQAELRQAMANQGAAAAATIIAERLAREVPDFDPRALDPQCIHGIPFRDHCPHCTPIGETSGTD